MKYERNSDGELVSASDAYTIDRYWIPFRSVKPYQEQLTPIRSVAPYNSNYTPVRTVKGFQTVRILEGGGNMPGLPEQAGSWVGFAGVDQPGHPQNTAPGVTASGYAQTQRNWVGSTSCGSCTSSWFDTWFPGSIFDGLNTLVSGIANAIPDSIALAAPFSAPTFNPTLNLPGAGAPLLGGFDWKTAAAIGAAGILGVVVLTKVIR